MAAGGHDRKQKPMSSTTVTPNRRHVAPINVATYQKESLENLRSKLVENPNALKNLGRHVAVTK